MGSCGGRVVVLGDVAAVEQAEEALALVALDVGEEQLEGLGPGADVDDGLVLADRGVGAQLGEDGGLLALPGQVHQLGVVEAAVESAGWAARKPR